jgi:hypothetical protein
MSSVPHARRRWRKTDPVLRWDQATLKAIATDASTPPFASRALAMESLAVYDTVTGIDGGHGYLVNMTAPSGASADAAVAAAADTILDYLYPAQAPKFDAQLAADLAAIADGTAKSDGIAFGIAVADKIIALRANDGWNTNVVDRGGSGVGVWTPTGPNFMPALLPQWANLEPFALTSPDQFDPAGPPDLTSAAYAAAVNETESLGAADSTTRTERRRDRQPRHRPGPQLAAADHHAELPGIHIGPFDVQRYPPSIAAASSMLARSTLVSTAAALSSGRSASPTRAPSRSRTGIH